MTKALFGAYGCTSVCDRKSAPNPAVHRFWDRMSNYMLFAGLKYDKNLFCQYRWKYICLKW
jgi:hypothetical protein